MDDMDYETQVAELLDATKARNIDGILSENVGLNIKVKAEGKMTTTGTSALRKAFEAKTFHGKLAKPVRAKDVPIKETYAERIVRLQDMYETEPVRDDDE